jgi:hypothetical protein
MNPLWQSNMVAVGAFMCILKFRVRGRSVTAVGSRGNDSSIPDGDLAR